MLSNTRGSGAGKDYRVPLYALPYFRFDEEALGVFTEWSGDLHRSKLPDEENPLIAQHMAKYDKLMPALALILHLVDCAASGQRGSVTKDAALRAAAWCDYLEAHARRCYGLLADDGLRAAQALADKEARQTHRRFHSLRREAKSMALPDHE